MTLTARNRALARLMYTCDSQIVGEIYIYLVVVDGEPPITVDGEIEYYGRRGCKSDETKAQASAQEGRAAVEGSIETRLQPIGSFV